MTKINLPFKKLKKDLAADNKKEKKTNENI